MGDHTKCFLNTETVLSLHQHFASGCIASGEYFVLLYECEVPMILIVSGLCEIHWVDTEIGQNQHYRKDCYQDPCPLAESVVRDDRVWTHLDSVIANSNRAFKTIDFE